MTTLWTLPVPSTALLSGVTFEKRLGRVVALRFSYEADDEGTPCDAALIFDGVEALQITYYNARGPSTLQAYDRLVTLGETPWLREVIENLRRHHADANGLAHYVIDFDDGPCYEVIGRSWRVEEQIARIDAGA